MAAEDAKYDDAFYAVAQQSGGLQEFLDNVSSFLRRRTNFFNEETWQTQLMQVFHEEAKKSNNTMDAANTKVQFPDIKDNEKIEVEKLKPNEGNGCDLPNYKWTQTLKEITMKIPLNCSKVVHPCDINIEIKRKHLTLGLKGQAPIVDDEFYQEIKANESIWMLDDGNILLLSLEKVDKTLWWERLMMKDPIICLQQLQPEQVKLSDLDGQKRATVEQMLNKQHNKQLGYKTENETEKMEMFEQFKKTHPELDFSKCKFGD